MLHRSFKPAKCKTALKLAASRIKLLKNKREAQVKQHKRELAQLLESGQDQTARIRVEHVVREEKTMAAYDLVEIYCELIVARLPIIESQKNCPIDLKEAVASIIFASPRCADLPELMDVRKHFTAKYGKEFVTAAVELRPDCGVSRLLVEKLSAKAPDGPTKLKILTQIAEEHNIKWDPKSFGEKDFKPAEDLLNGPNTFEQSSKFQVGQPNVQDSANRADMGDHVPSQHYVKHDVPANSLDPDLRSPPHSQNFLHRDMGANKTMPLGDSHPNPRPSGTGRGEVDHRHSYAGDRSGPTSSTQSWNIEFKDATSAAQAAAESAERASMAARAAAELSSQGRITRQQSTESLKGSSFVSRDEGARNHTGSKIQGEQFAKDRPSSTFYKKNPEMHCDQGHGNEQDDLAGLTERFNNLKSSNKSSQTALSKSSSASVDDYHSMNERQMSVRHSRKSSSELQRSSIFGETSVNQESSESEVDFVDEVEGGMGSENVGYFEDASIRKQASSISSNSHSKTFRDDPNLFNNLKSSNKSSQTALSKSSSASVDDYHSMNEPQMSVRHSRKSSSELQRSSIFGETSVNQESSESEVDFVDEVEGGMGSENVGYFEDASIRKQASSISLNSHSRTFSDDPNLFSNTSQQISNEKTDKELFMVEDERIQRDAKEANSHDNPVVFDDSGSENDEFMFDVADKNNGQERYSYFPSEDGKPSSHLLANANAWGPRQNTDELKSSSQTLFASEKLLNGFFSEDLTSNPVSSQSHDLLPVTFDESDGADSENEVELGTSGSEVVHSSSTGVFPDPTHSGNAHVIGSSNDSKTDEVFSEETQGIGANFETDSKFAYGNLYMAQTSPMDLKSGSSSDNLKDNLQTSGRSSVKANVQSYQTPITAKDVEPIEESSLETGTELNFRVLTGGLRNKGYRRPPYTRNLPDNRLPEQERTRQSSSSKVDISSGARDQESYNQLVHTKVDKKTNSKTPVRSSDSDEELPQQKFSSSQESDGRKPAIEANERLRAKAYFDSDNSDSEEVISKKNSTQKMHSGTGFSRRTKASPSSSNSDSSSQATMVSKSSVTAEDVVERKSFSGSSYATETQEKQHSPTRSSDYRGSFGQHRSTDQAASKRIQQSKRSSHEDSSSRSPYATDVQRSPLSKSKGLDYWPSSGKRRSSEPAAPKPVPESKKSLHEENLKSSTQEQPFNPPPKTVATGNTRNSKTSSSHGETPSTENSINKASHVHPKLPDYDTFAAHLLSLRQNRQ